MYKDVKKKILAIVLTIAVIVGVVQIPPMVRAAVDTTPTIFDQDNVHIELQPRMYNGTYLAPNYTAYYIDAGGNKIPLTLGAGFSEVKYGDNMATGTYPVEFKTDGTGGCKVTTYTTSYKIVPAQVIKVEPTLGISEWTGGAVYPNIQSVKVTTIENDIVYLQPSDYKVTLDSDITKNTAAGFTAPYTLEIKNANFDLTTIPTASGYYTIAHRLTASDIEIGPFDYSGSVINPTDALVFTTHSGQRISGNTMTNKKMTLTYSPSPIQEAGTYTVSIDMPPIGYVDFGTADPSKGTDLYFGTVSKTFTVNQKDISQSTIHMVKEDGTKQLVYNTTGYVSATYEKGDFPYYKYKGAGIEVIPKLEIVWKDGTTLQGNGVDYELIATPNPATAGVKLLEVKPKGNYSGSSLYFNYVVQSDITIEPLTITPHVYDGEIFKPTIVVKDELGTVLTDETDYYCEYQVYDKLNETYDTVPNTSDELRTVGKKRIVVYGKDTVDKYKGKSAEREYEIVAANMTTDSNRFKLNYTPNYYYTGEKVEPTLTVTDTKNGKTLVEGDDYTVEYLDANGVVTNECKNAGAYTISVTGCGNYEGSKTGIFRILPVDFSGMRLELSVPEDYTYNGQIINPKIVHSGGQVIYDGVGTPKGFTISGERKTPGEKTITLTANEGSGNYIGSCQLDFTINRASLAACTIVSSTSITWNGTNQGNNIKVTITDLDGVTTLTEGVDYILTCTNNTGVTASANYTIKATERSCYDYSETITGTYEILPRNLPTYTTVTPGAMTVQTSGSGVMYVMNGTQVYDAERDHLLVEGVDYEISYRDNDIAGKKACMTITGIGNYGGTLDKYFMCGYDIAEEGRLKVKLTFSGASANGLYYTGSAITPSSIVVTDKFLEDKELVEGTDYKISYFNATTGIEDDTVNAGKIQVVIEGITDKSPYYGKNISTTYTIKRQVLKQSDVVISLASPQAWVYKGTEIEPEVKVTLRNGTELKPMDEDGIGDFRLVYLNNINATDKPGDNNPFQVAFICLQEATISNYSYTAIPLDKNFQYDRYQIADKAIPHKTFEIGQAPLSNAVMKLNPETSNSVTYNGQKYEPEVEVMYNGMDLVHDTDYKVRYGANTNITGIDDSFVEIAAIQDGNFTGSKRFDFTIKPLELGIGKIESELRDKGSKILYIGKGMAVEPDKSDLEAHYFYNKGDVDLGDKGYILLADEDYNKISYRNNTNCGNAEMVIEGTKNCTGSAVIPFTIYKPISSFYELAAAGVETIASGSSIGLTTVKKLEESGNLQAIVKLMDVEDVTGTLSLPTDCYTVTIDEIAIGERELTITGNEEKFYTGTIKIPFTIHGDMSGVTVGKIKDQLYTGDVIQPKDFSVTCEGKPLRYGTDYILSYGDGVKNIYPGNEAVVNVIGCGNFQGKLEVNFRILYPLKDVKVELDGEEELRYKYSGEAYEPSVELFYMLTPGAIKTPIVAGYTVSYSDNTNAGRGKVTIRPDGSDDCYLKGDYITASFVIEKKDLTDEFLQETGEQTTSISATAYEYIPTGVKPKPVLIDEKISAEPLTLGYDYKIVYGENKAIGLTGGAITIIGQGNYTGTLEKTFPITQKKLNDNDHIKVTGEDVFFTGTPQEPYDLKVSYTDIFGVTHVLDAEDDYYISAYYKNGTPISTSIDPSVNAQAPSDRGEYTVEITGKGNYENINKTFTYLIDCKDMANMDIIAEITEPVVKYDGTVKTPEIIVKDGAKELELGKDYTVSYFNETTQTAEDITNAGNITVTITGIGNYTGTTTIPYVIERRDIASIDNTTFTFTYNGEKGDGFMRYEGKTTPSVPDIKVWDRFRAVDLISKEADAAHADYRVLYKTQYGECADYEQLATDETKPCWAGKIVMTIEGVGNYIGSVEEVYYIGTDVSSATATIDKKTSEYDGLYKDIKVTSVSVDNLDIADNQHKITCYYGSVAEENKVAIDKFENAGTYYVTVDGIPEEGTYAAEPSLGCTHVISPKSIFNVTVDGFDSMVYYTGSPITFSGLEVTDQLPSIAGGSTVKKVKLTPNVDYTITYSNNLATGKATINVLGKGNYKSIAYAYFTIESSQITGGDTEDGTTSGTGLSNGVINITDEDIILSYSGSGYMNYTGYAVVPAVTIVYSGGTLTQGVDYVVTGSNNIDAGVGTVTIEGRGNFSGSMSKTFRIKANLASATVANIADQKYTGTTITPVVTVNCGGNVLNQGTDYTLTYSNNVNPGVATVTINAISSANYYGSISKTFNISNSAGGMSVTGYASSYTYTGAQIAPSVTVMMNGSLLTPGRDYTVRYSNNTNVGTATMTVTGLGSYSGTQTLTYYIAAKNIQNCNVTEVTDKIYTGSTYTPSITVTDPVTGKTLTKGTDYSLTYKNNTNPGTASIVITALNKNYTGTKEVTFRITSDEVENLRATNVKSNSMKLKWAKQEYADGYQICNQKNKVVATTTKNTYNIKGLAPYTTYKFKVRSYVENADGSISYGDFSPMLKAKTKLRTPTLKTMSTSKGRVVLSWNKVSKAQGYELFVSNKKDGVYTRIKTVSNGSTISYVDSGLASGKRYYYTIRAYRKVNGEKVYSNYNTIKTVSVK